jgi:phosphatidylethanolamine/phosphatidyl-N-methylethanolamine N-methyltransferase
MKMTESATSRCYDLWALFYDKTFGALVHQRQIRALEQLRPGPGERVLDIGVGTGMTLRHYPHDITVVGMDLSGGMLGKAARKVEQDGLTHCRLVQGDAMVPPFADHSFDHVMITHVISVVSDPQRLLYWAQRLVKPGGRIVILNHFLSTNPFLAFWEKRLNPMFVKIGWRSDLSLDECLGDFDLHVQYRFKMSLIDFWQIVVLTAHTPGVSRSPLDEPSRRSGSAASGRGRLAMDGH